MFEVHVVSLCLLAVMYLSSMGLVTLGMFLRGREPQVAARPSVSVVIPAHNEERDLPATLASLSAQAYPGRAEFVIVDDRSEDGTAEAVRRAAARDARVRLVQVHAPSTRLSPKVNAVDHGIRASSGEIVVTSDADCRYPAGWLERMVAHFAPGVVMVVGYVETTRKRQALRWLHLFETIDWLSLMLTSRSLTRLGFKFASSANNQAYRRAAFDAAGGFGAPGRAPSGDEDLLAQRLGRLPRSRMAFASLPETRVLTKPAASWGALLRQRRRWVSRYHHAVHYHPAFFAGIAVLGAHSVLLSSSIVLTPWMPAMVPWVAGVWGAEVAMQLVGMSIGARQLGREDLLRPALVGWSLLHPFFISVVVLWSLFASGEWRAGAQTYRRRMLARKWRTWLRRFRPRA